MTVEQEVGRRVHTVVAALAGSGPAPHEVLEVVHDLWRADPVGGSTSASARLRCATAASVYFQRCHPSDAWTCEGSEVDLGVAVADLVWTARRGRVVVDELKTGIVDPADSTVADQLCRLADGGRRRWGDRFAGVRLVPLGAPARTTVFTLRRGTLTVVPTPSGMTVP